VFLYIDPLKQGLKHDDDRGHKNTEDKFLYIDPLKQGLKPEKEKKEYETLKVFIHRSIKTRIETSKQIFINSICLWFLYIDPLKQGLKLIKHFKPPLATSLFLYIDPLKQGLKHFTYRIAHAFIICFYT